MTSCTRCCHDLARSAKAIKAEYSSDFAEDDSSASLRNRHDFFNDMRQPAYHRFVGLRGQNNDGSRRFNAGSTLTTNRVVANASQSFFLREVKSSGIAARFPSLITRRPLRTGCCGGACRDRHWPATHAGYPVRLLHRCPSRQSCRRD